MCIGGTPKAPDPLPAPPPPPPVVAPTVLKTAQSEGSVSESTGTSKGRKALRIDLATSNVSGSSGLNLPTGG